MNANLLLEFLEYKRDDRFHTFQLFEDNKILAKGNIDEIAELYHKIYAKSLGAKDTAKSLTKYNLPLPLFTLKIDLNMPNNKTKKILILSESERVC